MGTKPRSIKVNGQVFEATVLKVTGRDPDGTPRTFEIMKPNESTKVEEGMAFFVVYAIPEINKRRN